MRYKPTHIAVHTAPFYGNEDTPLKQLHDMSTKPYYRCILCPKFRIMCGGMPTRGLDQQGWCECIRDVMDYFHLSCAFVSKEANVSLRTVERIHAVNIEQDIMRSVCRSIELVVFGPVTRLLCEMDYDASANEKIAQLQAEVDYWRKENDRKAKIIDRYLDN